MNYKQGEMVRITLDGFSRPRLLSWLGCRHERRHEHVNYADGKAIILAIIVAPRYNDTLVKLLDCPCKLEVDDGEITKISPLEQLALL